MTSSIRRSRGWPPPSVRTWPVHAFGRPGSDRGDAGRDLLYHSNASYETLLTLARLGMLPFLLLLLAATWPGCGAGMASRQRCWRSVPGELPGDSRARRAWSRWTYPVTALTVRRCTCCCAGSRSRPWPAARRWVAACGLAVATKMSAMPFIGIAALTLVCLRVAVRCTAACRDAAALRTAYRASRAWPGAAARAPAPRRRVRDRLVYLTTPELAPSPRWISLRATRGALHDLAYRIAARVPVPLRPDDAAR